MTSLVNWYKAQPSGIDESHDQRIDALMQLVDAIAVFFSDVEPTITCVGTHTIDQIEGLFPVVRLEIYDIGIIHLKKDVFHYTIGFDLVAPIPLDFRTVASYVLNDLESELTEGFPENALPEPKDCDNQRFIALAETSYNAYALFVLIHRELQRAGFART